jgi:hypothetical protein
VRLLRPGSRLGRDQGAEHRAPAVSAEVVSLEAWQAAEARRLDFAQHTQADGPTLAIECALAAVTREIGRLDPHQRIAIERALWHLLDEVDHRDFHPW